MTNQSDSWTRLSGKGEGISFRGITFPWKIFLAENYIRYSQVKTQWRGQSKGSCNIQVCIGIKYKLEIIAKYLVNVYKVSSPPSYFHSMALQSGKSTCQGGLFETVFFKPHVARFLEVQIPKGGREPTKTWNCFTLISRTHDKAFYGHHYFINQITCIF